MCTFPLPCGPAANAGSLRLLAAKKASERCNFTPSKWDPVGNIDHRLAKNGFPLTVSDRDTRGRWIPTDDLVIIITKRENRPFSGSTEP
jgi:hypothetical protein